MLFSFKAKHAVYPTQAAPLWIITKNHVASLHRGNGES